MTAIVAASKSYFIAPEDGWVQIVSGASTAINFLRISAYPHTKPFEVAVASSKPATSVPGIVVCHNAFKVFDATNGINAVVYVKVASPGNMSGKTRIDVYSEGGVLA